MDLAKFHEDKEGAEIRGNEDRCGGTYLAMVRFGRDRFDRQGAITMIIEKNIVNLRRF